MANPQKENGYTPIATEILDSLVNTPLLGAEFQIVLFIIRKTYGFHKKNDRISLTQFEKATKLSRPTVVKTLKNLVIKNIIVKDNKFNYSYQKNYEKWVVNTPLLVKYKNTTSKDTLTKTSKDTLTHNRYKIYTKDNSTFDKSKDATNKNMKNSFKYSEKQHSDNFEDIIDLETNEPIKSKEPKKLKAINYIKDYFILKCYKDIKIKPILTYKQNIIIANLFKKGLKPSELVDIINWYFDNEQDDKKKIQIGFCLSSYNINNYKLMTNKKFDYENK